MIKIIGKEFSVCTAQAELVVNPRLGLRGELAPYMFPTVTDQEEISFPIVCHGVLPSAVVQLSAAYFPDQSPDQDKYGDKNDNEQDIFHGCLLDCWVKIFYSWGAEVGASAPLAFTLSNIHNSDTTRHLRI